MLSNQVLRRLSCLSLSYWKTVPYRYTPNVPSSVFKVEIRTVRVLQVDSSYKYTSQSLISCSCELKASQHCHVLLAVIRPGYSAGTDPMPVTRPLLRSMSDVTQGGWLTCANLWPCDDLLRKAFSKNQWHHLKLFWCVCVCVCSKRRELDLFKQ